MQNEGPFKIKLDDFQTLSLPTAYSIGTSHLEISVTGTSVTIVAFGEVLSNWNLSVHVGTI